MALQRYAKLTQPRTDPLVMRERLFALLDQARERTVVWIAAPPGAGKTSLVSTYLQARKLPVLWYQLDTGDADPATFFHYVSIAAQPLLGRQAKPLPQFAVDDADDIARFARRFFRQLLSQLADGAQFVLDNYQDVPPASTLHQALVIACEECPPPINLVVLSHVDPPAVYARLRAAQRITSVDWAQLRLDFAETAQLAQKDGALPAATLDALHEQTAGWPAGLVLLVERLRQTGQLARIASIENLEGVFDYFAAQILAALPAPIQDMLLRMSYLPRLTAETAGTITGDSEAVRLLEQLARRNLFTDRRYGAETSYQFHGLFRAFLQQQARARIGAAEHQKLLLSAASLLQVLGHPEEAFPLLSDAGAWDSVQRLILKEADHLVQQGRWQTLRQWIGALPAQRIDDSPWLLYWQGMASVGVDAPRGRDLLARASETFASAHDRRGELLAVTNLLQALLSSFADARLRDPWLERLEDLLRERQLPDEPALLAHAQAVRLLAVFRGKPLTPSLHDAAAHARALLDADIPVDSALSLAGGLLHYYWWLGRNADAQEVTARMDVLADDARASDQAKAHYAFARLHFLLGLGAFEEVAASIERVRRLRDESGLGPLPSDFTVFRVAALRAVGDNEAAFALLRGELAPQLPQLRFENVAFYHSNSALLALQMGRSELAATHMEAGLRAVKGSGLSQLFMTVVQILVLAARARFDEGTQVIADKRALFEESGSGPILLSLAFAEAYLHKCVGDTEVMADVLRSALRDAAARDVTNSLVMVREIHADLCAEALARGIEVDYVRRLIKLRRWSSPALEIEPWPWPLRICAFDAFSIARDDKPLARGAKSNHRLLDLLKVIVCSGREGAPAQGLTEALWPDSEGDSAQNTLQVSLSRLRKLLGYDDLIQMHDGRVRLDRRICWVDAWAFEDKAERWQSMRATDSARLPLAEEMLELYRGHLFARDSEQPWMLSTRERLRRLWLQVVKAVGDDREAGGRWHEAVVLYQRSLDVDPLNEDLYRRLMRAQGETGAHVEVLETYRLLRVQLQAAFGVPPSPETDRLLQALRKR